MQAVPKASEERIGAAVRRRLAGFIATLRQNDFQVGTRDAHDALTLLAGPLGRRSSDLRPAFRALFCGRRSEWERFDDLFDAYWLGRGMKRSVQMPASTGLPSPSLARLMPGAESTGAPELSAGVQRAGAEASEPQEGRGRREGASRAETLSRTDLRKLADPDEIAEAHKLTARLAKSMRARLTRREKSRRHGPRLDLRRTIHRSVASGGVPLDVVRRAPRRKPLRLIVLLDVSGSMSLYTGTFLRFVHGVLDNFREAEAFLFHTRLVHVSLALREKDAGRALDRLSLMAEGLGGGTRIGESLKTFNAFHAKRVINSRSCVMILSDGYDTGEPGALGAEMAALGRRCRRIVWLNPLIGWEGYEPTARGMAEALPHVDLFAPAHTLESLAALEPYLARL